LSKMLRVGLLASVLAIAILGIISGVYTFSPANGSASPFLGAWFGIDCDWSFGPFFVVGTVFSTANMVLSAILLITYVGTYRKTKAEFNLVLIIVAVTLLCYSFVANPLVITVLGYGASGLGPFFMLPDLFTFVTLSALLYLSLRY